METSRRVDEGLGSQSRANGGGARETVRGKWTGGIWWRITSLSPSSLPPAFFYYYCMYCTAHASSDVTGYRGLFVRGKQPQSTSY